MSHCHLDAGNYLLAHAAMFRSEEDFGLFPLPVVEIFLAKKCLVVREKNLLFGF
jgi:hypothetical protein